MNDLIEFSTCTGFFGEVFKGRMSDTSDQNTMEVAVKTLKGRWLRWMPAHYSMHGSSYHYLMQTLKVCTLVAQLVTLVLKQSQKG